MLSAKGQHRKLELSDEGSSLWIQGCVIHSQWNKHVYGQAAAASPPSYLFITGAGTYAKNPLLNVRIRKVKIALPLDPRVWHSPMSK